MTDTTLLHHLIEASATRNATAPALTFGSMSVDYGKLWREVTTFASGLARLGVGKSQRVAVFLDKRLETVVSLFGTVAAGGVFVPINPLLRAPQVAYILRDCNVRVLVTTRERHALLADSLDSCPDLMHVVLINEPMTNAPASHAIVHGWSALQDGPPCHGHRVIDTDMAAILYTSGSTGKPKGVVLSHRNMVAGAKSVASYLENRAERHVARRAAAVVRRGLQPADDRLPRRRTRRAAELPAAARRAERARAGARHRPDRGAAALHPACAARMAVDHRRRICATSPTPAGACRSRR